MKVDLIVTQGRSEGRIIPLVGPVFRVGRGETCHLRPNNERVSREHAEFTVTSEGVVIRDLGSRNGTLVNGKALGQPHRLSHRDVVQIGPLTFLVSIIDGPKDSASPALAGILPAQTPEPVPAPPELPAPPPFSPVGAGQSHETLLLPAFNDPQRGTLDSYVLAVDDDDQYERLPVLEGETAVELPTMKDAPNADSVFSAPPPLTDSRSPARRKETTDAAMEIFKSMMGRQRVAK